MSEMSKAQERMMERLQEASEQALIRCPSLMDEAHAWLRQQPTWLDQCAWHAMQGILSTYANALNPAPGKLAFEAYRYAAAMLAEKRKREAGGAS